jgi:Tfp pilus tip-associated adhesin PilY1
MRKNVLRVALLGSLALWAAWAAPVFDPRFQPIGYGGSYTLSKSGLAAGDAAAFQPVFDAERWSGDVLRRAVSSMGDVSTTHVWSAAQLLNDRDYKTRVIFTRRDDTGSAISFASRADFSPAQQSQIPSQAVLDFLRGSRLGEGTTYRARNGVLGDILHSNLVYVGTPNANNDSDRVYVGANDGMLHAFNAKTGAEVFAYVPSTLFSTLSLLSKPDYNLSHRYFVDGGMAVENVTFSDGTMRKVLISGLGAGGQGYFALDITSGDASNIARTLLWEVNDRSTAAASPAEQKFNELGFTYAAPSIVKVAGTSGPRNVVIIGNGYASTLPDGPVGSGTAYLMVLDVETGTMLRAINTGEGSASDPNGLSSPRVIDVDADGIADFAYAGDLNGNLWRFDLRSKTPSEWKVSFSGEPLFVAQNQQGQRQSITVQPTVAPHPNGGAIVLFGTGRILEDEDIHDTSTSNEIQSVYGVRDRFNEQPARADTLIVQEVNEFTYTDPVGSAPAVQVRTSSNVIVPATADGWVVDLEAGERVITPVQIRSGRVVLTTTNPLFDNQKNWLQELNYLTGGTPDIIVFDMNNDNARDANDNVDANGDGDRLDLIDRVTGIYQGEGIVSGATLAVLSADEGTFLLNQQPLTQPILTVEKGVAGGHFDVDTASFIAPINAGTTDGHVHQYDDKYDVVGVDYFKFLEAQLHNINRDISDPDQRF